jgi:drug/metabolite transporter (DMT)-like permease
MGRRDWSWLLVLAAIWGSSYLFIKIGVREMSPSMVVFLRVALGALVLVPFAWRRGALSGIGGAWPVLCLVALIQVAAPFLLIAEGEEEISSALAGILVASVPIFSAVLAIFFDQEERSDGIRGVGVLLGIFGVVLLLGVDLEGAALLGGLAVVLASLGYAVGGLLVKKRLRGIEPIAVAAIVLAVSAIATLPLAVMTAPAEAPGAGPLAAVAALGVLGTGIAFAIFYGLIARVGPSRSFVVTYLAPGFAVFYGALLLDETITAATVGGLALILGGSFLAAEGRFPWRSPPGAARAGEIGDDDPAAGGLSPARD